MKKLLNLFVLVFLTLFILSVGCKPNRNVEPKKEEKLDTTLVRSMHWKDYNTAFALIATIHGVDRDDCKNIILRYLEVFEYTQFAFLSTWPDVSIDTTALFRSLKAELSMEELINELSIELKLDPKIIAQIIYDFEVYDDHRDNNEQF